MYREARLTGKCELIKAAVLFWSGHTIDVCILTRKQYSRTNQCCFTQMDYRATLKGRLGTKWRRRSVAERLMPRAIGEKGSLSEKGNLEFQKLRELFTNGSFSIPPSVRNFLNAHFTKTIPDNDERTLSKIWRRKKYSQPALICKTQTEEQKRLEEDKIDPNKSWKQWGPYLSERQWGTVREDYSEDGNW